MVIGIAFAVATAFLGAGETRPLDSVVPQEAMAVYFGRPSPEMMAAPQGGAIQQGLDSEFAVPSSFTAIA